MKKYQLLSITRYSPIKGDTYSIIEFEKDGEMYEYRVEGVLSIPMAESLIELILEFLSEKELEEYKVQPEEEPQELEHEYAELYEMLYARKVITL